MELQRIFSLTKKDKETSFLGGRINLLADLDKLLGFNNYGTEMVRVKKREEGPL